MEGKYKKKTIKALLVLLGVFSLTFAASLYAMKEKYVLVPFNLPYGIENWIVMVLSVIAIIRVVVSIVKVERE